MAPAIARTIVIDIATDLAIATTIAMSIAMTVAITSCRPKPYTTGRYVARGEGIGRSASREPFV